MKPRVLLCAPLLGLLGACKALESDVAQPGLDPFASLATSPLLLPDEAFETDPSDSEESAGEEEIEPLLAPTIGGEEEITLSFRGTPLPEALHLIAESAGINLYLDSSLPGVIDASFPNVRLGDALQSILSRNGLALVEEPAGIFWVRVADGTERGTLHHKLHSIKGGDLLEKLQALVSTETAVVIEENQNIVLARGPQEDLDVLSAFLTAADHLKPQVLVEVNLFEVGMDENFQFGVSHALQGTINDNTIGILQSLLAPDDNFQITLDDADGDIRSVVEALREYVGLELISSPKVLAITNTQATIEILEEVPYVNVTSVNDAGGGSSVLEEVEFKEAGIKLVVTPTVQEDGILQIVVDQELSEVVGFFNAVPILDTRHLISQFLVADRQTTVLGGLMQDERRDTVGGVPILMDIPWLGRLFRNDDDTSEKRELLIFLTPRIVDPKQAAKLGRFYQENFKNSRRRIGFEGEQE